MTRRSPDSGPGGSETRSGDFSPVGAKVGISEVIQQDHHHVRLVLRFGGRGDLRADRIGRICAADQAGGQKHGGTEG